MSRSRNRNSYSIRRRGIRKVRKALKHYKFFNKKKRIPREKGHKNLLLDIF